MEKREKGGRRDGRKDERDEIRREERSGERREEKRKKKEQGEIVESSAALGFLCLVYGSLAQTDKKRRASSPTEFLDSVSVGGPSRRDEWYAGRAVDPLDAAAGDDRGPEWG